MMAPLLITIVTIVVLGLPVALALRPSARPGETLGLAWLLGCGVLWAALLLMSIVGIRWTLAGTLVAAIAISAAFLLWRRGALTPAPATSTAPRSTPLSLLADAVTCFVLLGYAFYTTLARLWEWDFWAIWGLKARVFYEHGGIDWAWLQNPFNSFAHNDYPILLTTLYDAAALASGRWDDRWLGLLFVAFATAITLVARDLLRRHTAPLIASLGTIVITSIAATRFVGLAEGPLIAFSGAGLLYLYEENRNGGDVRLPAVLLGLAACCKNEGLAFLAAAALALIVTPPDDGEPRRWRRVASLWPALAIAAPWLLLRAIHTLPTDLAEGSVTTRLTAHLHQLPDILGWLAASLADRAFWLVLVVCWIVAAVWQRTHPQPTRDGGALRLLFLATAIQLFFYLGSYLVTPNEVRWHIATSWSRLTAQLSVPVVFATVVLLGRLWESQIEN